MNGICYNIYNKQIPFKAGDNMTTDEKLDVLLQNVHILEQEINDLKQEVKHNSIITENTINKCIQVMGEGIQLNAERFDRLDIDSVRLKAEQALLLVQLVNDKVDKISA